MATKKKTTNNFKRNIFFFFLFIVLAGITFYPLDQKQLLEPNAQTMPQPTFVSLADCTTNQNCPSPEVSTAPLPSGTTNQPTGGESSSTNDTLIQELISLLRQLIALFGGNGCPTSGNDMQASSFENRYYDDTDTGLVTAFSRGGKKQWNRHGRGHRHWKKWHKKHHKGLLKKWKCKNKADKTSGQTPVPSVTPVPSDVPTPSDMPVPSEAPQPSSAPATCGQPGDQGNSQGVGKYCTKGGGECQGGQAPYCALDFKTDVPGICSKPCASDLDCGENARCSGTGLEKGCEPTACAITP